MHHEDSNSTASISVIGSTLTLIGVDYCSLFNGSISNGSNPSCPLNPIYFDQLSVPVGTVLNVSNDHINGYRSEGYNYVYFEAGAAGGGGGGGTEDATLSNAGAGGGGGSGETYSVILNLSELTNITVNAIPLGAPGMGGNKSSGNVGGDTTFTITASYETSTFSTTKTLKGGRGGRDPNTVATASDGGDGYYAGGGGVGVGNSGTANPCANSYGQGNGYL